MKKIFLIFCLATLGIAHGQAKKPTIMVVPSDNWCTANGYVMKFENQGITEVIPDYRAAFQGNPDLLLVISKINGIMGERQFPLENMESVIKSLNSYEAEDALRSSKSGSEIEESAVDRFKSVAKADIIMQLTWTLNEVGPKKSVTFNLQGIDAYSNKQIATAVGTGAPSFATELPVLLEEAVLSHMDNFANTLQNHFDDMFENGREITIRVKKWDDWEYDIESEFGGEELGFIIEDWMADNTMNSRFTTRDATENMLVFDQVRIPLFFSVNGRDRPMDTRRFAKSLSEFLEKSPYNIVSKITTRGLGEATIYLGSK